MFDVSSYLSKLGYNGSLEPTVRLLRELQKRHLVAIPFDNSLNADAKRGLEVLGDVDIDVDAVFGAIVVGGRGGVCYELNGLMRKLLQELGYDTHILSAGVIQVNGGFGPDLEHIFNAVHVDGEIWLVDVGLAGPSYLEPLRFPGAGSEEIQTLHGVEYRFVEADGYHVLQRRARGAEWGPMYRFRLEYRKLSDWGDVLDRLADFPLELSLLDTRLHSRAFDNGQWVLIGRRYLRIEDGREEIRILAKPEQYRKVVDMVLRGEA